MFENLEFYLPLNGKFEIAIPELKYLIESEGGLVLKYGKDDSITLINDKNKDAAEYFKDYDVYS